MRIRFNATWLAAAAVALATGASAQQEVPRYEGGVPVAPTGIADNPLPAGPFRYRTAEGMDVRVEVVARDIEYPMALAFLPDRAMLIVTHRLSTAMRADQIHVMEDACIVESGTHDELIAKGGRYAACALGGHDRVFTAMEVTAR